MDLFTPTAPDTPLDQQQHRLRKAMEADYALTLRLCKKAGVIAPWMESDGLLEADEFKLLSLIADNAGRVYYGGQDRAVLAEQMGFRSTGNLEAVVKKCLTRELITITTERHIRDDGMRADRQRVNATHYGMALLEETEHERGAAEDAAREPDGGVWPQVQQ